MPSRLCRVKRWPVVCAMLLAAGLGFVVLERTRPPARPRLVFDSEQIDLGVLEPGRHAFHFSVGNTGSSELEILEIASSCGCTTVGTVAPIPPGGTGQVEGAVSVAGGSGSAQLNLMGNDPDSPHTIYLSWFGKRPPVFVPSSLSVTLKPDEVTTREFRAVYTAGASLDFRGVSVPDERLRCRVVDSHPSLPGQRMPTDSDDARTSVMVLELKITAPSDTGRYSLDPLLLFTQKSVDYEVRLPVVIDVSGPLVTRPDRIFVGAESRDALLNRSVRLRVLSECPASQVRVSAHPDFVQCRLDPQGETEARLEVTVVKVPPDNSPEFSISIEGPHGVTTEIPGRLIYGTGTGE